MAFKFKTKKRPTAAQAFAGGFAQGVSSGIQQAAQLSLQDRLKKQEEEKNRLKTQLDLFNGMIGNIEESSANKQAILKGKQMIIRTDGKVGASQAFSSISPDFTFTPTKAEQEAATKLSIDPEVMALERSAMGTIGMGGLKPTESIITRREELADIQAGIKADPRATIEIIDPVTKQRRMVTKDQALQLGVITELAPTVKPEDLVEIVNPDGSKSYIKKSEAVGMTSELAPEEKTVEIYDPNLKSMVTVPISVGMYKPLDPPSDRPTARDKAGILRYMDGNKEKVFFDDMPDREIRDDRNGVPRFVDTNEEVFPDVEAEPVFEKDAFNISRNVKTGELQFPTDAKKNVFRFETAPDGHKRYIEGPNKNQKVFPGIKLPNKFQLKTLKNGDEALFNPATGEITVKVANKQRSADDNTDLKNLLKERTRLLAKKKGDESFSFGFDDEKSFTFSTGGGEFTDADTEKLKKVENELATRFDYGWLISEYDMTDADRPPSVPKEAWDRSTEAEKKEVVNAYQESLLLDKQEPRTLSDDSQTRYPISNNEPPPAIADVEANDQIPPSVTDVGFTAQAPTQGASFRLPPELVKRFNSGTITVQEVKGDKIAVTTDTGVRKVIPLAKWYTFRFAPTN
jgi:hypothetical protein